MSTTTWFDTSTTGYEAANIGPLFLRETLGYYDVRYWGAMLDLKSVTSSASAGSPIVTGTFLTANGDAGKRAHLTGGGSVLATASDGAMSLAVPYQTNILTSASASFDTGMVGRQVTIPGAGSGGATLTTKVWGVISPTQLRTTANCTTTVTGSTYVIADDLYANVIASTTSNLTLDANVSVAVTNVRCYVATDDSDAIEDAITAALADTPRSKQSASPTIYFATPFGVTRPIEVNTSDPTHCRIRLLGGGLQGFSQLLAQGSVFMRAMAPELNAFIRFSFGGTGSGLGVRGSITSGLKVLTDPDASWVSGDLGKRVEVVGAGAQSGSTTQVSLRTTIASVDSATQVTLTAAASTTVVEGVYSWVGAGVQGVTNAFSVERLHLMGDSGHKCGIHTLAAAEYEFVKTTVSDFRSGIGHFGDGNPSNTQCMSFDGCGFHSCRIGAKIHAANIVMFNGFNFFDGNNNLVAVVPGPGTIGLDCDGFNAGNMVIQAYETALRADGGTGSAMTHVTALGLEACPLGIEFHGTGVNGGKGNVISCISWSTSGVGGANGLGLVLKAGVQDTVFTPGYYLPSNINMYGGCDATALADTITLDPQSPMQAGGVSTTTPGAVTTVSIAHGLRATPTRFSAERGDANARGAPAYYVTVTSTNVVLNFASALTAATPYTWNWTSGI